jgi:predicted transcriptional regulator
MLKKLLCINFEIKSMLILLSLFLKLSYMNTSLLNREKIIESLRKLPDQVALDEVLERIILLDKIENGLRQSEQGQVITDEELDEKLPEWLKSSGQNKP